MSATVVDKLKKIIAEELDVNLQAEEIDENLPLFEDGLGFDSIATVELISLMENHFSISFSDSELNLASFSNLQVLAEFIAKKMES
ncbi:acyl carrier protein [Aphanizomenon flos-aquae NRERC-008]|jgi:acyl carrier protein|uniref:Acyl carrier protein n=2 Tax=Aphanizomenon flos-aquae TaxID=1176 RepID=A0A1B7X7I9_APHFL|nr:MULTISPECIES: acyl carrier protein [Aphanizomenon]MBD1219013.1 acyl carrier protein [Aphanizomenon flos-aquae Clear-A1]MCE2904621.1 acyl carrier protein [Anabaena sp. CoA2_C59]NTW19251.1 acyl carrier protein [Nostocales cyanobacterium W4_Combined_metabat2_030]OBQ19884.1 MAG: acyl carrier protein [Anabaena sp. WA113]OBQ45302.1 MAG: acyl carrier protein [Aphanizomenon flos-aquae WA102]QSV66978.1 MAG: acyl carrier protein [Aphanizomenon flos-aquae DEX188]